MSMLTLVSGAFLLCLPACDSGESVSGNVADAPPTLRVGHVGHDHQLALYVAAMEGEGLARYAGVWLRVIREREVYDLVRDGRTLARLNLVKVGGGAAMPAAMARGEIDLGLGGVMPVAKLVDQGSDLRIIAPLQTDGDMLVLNNEYTCDGWPEFVGVLKTSDRPLRIGYKAPTAVAKLIFERALTHEGIAFSMDAADVEARVLLVNMNSEGGWPPLMERGAIDGFVMNQPAPAMAEYRKLGRVVCDLSSLPPTGAWVNHPCCCVAATPALMTRHPEAVEAFLLLLRSATDAIGQDLPAAASMAAQWTSNSLSMELRSVATICYVSDPDDAWLKGMKTWLAMMDDIALFNGQLVEGSTEATLQRLCDLDLCTQAQASYQVKRKAAGQ